MLDCLREWPAGTPIPGLTIRQPAAAAVAWLGRDVESRTQWVSRYRGPFVIHSDLRPPAPEELEETCAIARRNGIDGARLTEFQQLVRELPELAMPLGCIVAVVELYDVLYPGAPVPLGHPTRHSRWMSLEAGVWLCFRNVTPVMPTEFRGHVGQLMVPFHLAASFRPFALIS